MKMINGIKPKMSTTTKLRIKPTSFDEAMDAFCTRLEENCKPYVDKFNHMDSVVFRPDGGVKYIKVKSFEDKIMTNYDENGVEIKKLHKDTRGSIHCFVEKSTGDIFKPAGYKAPYTKGKNCVRGNIYDASTFEKTDLHGGWLYVG